MSEMNPVRILDEVLAGRITIADAAWRMDISEAEAVKLLREYSLHGSTAVSEGLLARLQRSVQGRMEEIRLHLHSYPAMRRLKMKAAYSLASFTILAFGVLMLGACSSVFPGASNAAEKSTAMERLEGSLAYRDSVGVDRQLQKAGSVYDRVLKVLEKSGSSRSAALRKKIEQRKQSLTRIRTRIVREGLPTKHRVAARPEPGAIYERMLDVVPLDDLKKMTPLALQILERAQNGEQRLRKVAGFYRSNLRKPADHYQKIVKKITEPEPLKAEAGKTVAMSAPAKENRKAVIRQVVSQHLQAVNRQYEEEKSTRMNARRYKPFTRMPVISRFNRGNQILRTLEKGAAMDTEMI